MKTVQWFILLFVAVFWLASGCQNKTQIAENSLISESLGPYVRSIDVDNLGEVKPDVQMQKVDNDIHHIRLVFALSENVAQDDWQVKITPAFQPDFHWSPHLTPTNDCIIDQHAFRSPALIARSQNKLLTLIPDLNIMKQSTPVRWYLDLDAPQNTLTLGMSDYDVKPGLFFIRKAGAVYPAGKVEFGFYIFTSDDRQDIQNPWRRPLAFLWENWGRSLFESGLPLSARLEESRSFSA